jgi:hypothetical protein
MIIQSCYIARWIMKRLMLAILITGLCVSTCMAGWLSGWTKRAEITLSGTSASTNQILAVEAYYSIPKVAENGIFEWFGRPCFKYNNKTYVCYYANDLKSYVRYFDNTSKVWSSPTELISSWGDAPDVAGTQADDHSDPTVIVLQRQTGDNAVHNGKVLIVDAEHNVRAKSWRSTNAEDISSFEAAVDLETTGASYAYVLELSNGTIFYSNRIFNAPSTGHHGVYYRTSTTAGASYSSRSLLFDGGDAHSYVMYDINSDGSVLHAMFNIANHNEPSVGYSRYKNIYYAKYVVADNKWYKADGTEITLPMDLTTTGHIPDLVFASTESDWTFLWDIRVIDGSPYMISLNQDEGWNYEEDYDYTFDVQRHSWNGSSWVTEIVCTSYEMTNDHHEDYAGGAVIDGNNPDIIYACSPDGSNRNQLQKWEKSAGVWSKTEDITQASAGHFFRPMFVKNASANDLFKVLVCYTEDYNYDHDWTSSLFAYPGYNSQTYLKLNKNSRTDFGDIRFTASDGTTLLGYQGKPWIISKTNSWMANLKLRVPSVAASPSKTVIYCYYGKPDATYPDLSSDTEEESAVTLLLQDDFSGSSLNTSVWETESGSVVVSGGELILDGSDKIAMLESYGQNTKFSVRAKSSTQDISWLWLTESKTNDDNFIRLFNTDNTSEDTDLSVMFRDEFISINTSVWSYTGTPVSSSGLLVAAWV